MARRFAFSRDYLLLVVGNAFFCINLLLFFDNVGAVIVVD